jgi:tripartite-type tricarboxylate transporter receptor subunit TctC
VPAAGEHFQFESPLAGKRPFKVFWREPMKLPRRQFLHLAAGAVALPALPRIARAQAYPTRPVTMVIPFAAGAGPDVVGRVLVPRLSEILGQQVIVENVGDAGGMTGTARVAKAAPDGYEFVLGTHATHVTNQSMYKNPLYNAATDFAPVVAIGEVPFVLIARKALATGNLREFIAYARANQAKMKFGSGGKGSMPHLACEIFNAAIGVNITHTPVRAASGLESLVTGQVDYQCPAGEVASRLYDSNSMDALAILTKDRWPNMPNLASAHEQGLTDFEVSGLFALYLPKGTPAATIQNLHDAAVATMNTPAVAAKLKELGVMVTPPERRSPDYLQKFVEREIEKWAAVIKAAGISAD